MTTVSLTRLHITPLNPDLLPIVLGKTLSKSAQNVSYQTIDTFPEANYGFVDLPQTDAKKLIAKLNGAILKGRKMKLEEARSRKRSHQSVNHDESSVPEKAVKKTKTSKKDKTLHVLEGHELPTDRKVKRGWTEPKSDRATSKKVKEKEKKSSKHQAPSKYTEKAELLFHTKLPANKKDLDFTKKSKKSKSDKASTDTIVHEFERTGIQPSFLRDTTSSSRRAAGYVDNVGWVDEEGEVIEKKPSTTKKGMRSKAEGLMIDIPIMSRAKSPSKMLESALSSSTSSPTTSSISAASAPNGTNRPAEPYNDDTSSSGISSSSPEAESRSESEAEEDMQLLARTPNESAPETPPKIHPLEALFKRPNPPVSQEPAKPSLEIETSFSFFGKDGPADDEDDEVPPMPATPFTSQELHSRGVRSAAPTPDTAHPSRFTSFASALAARPTLRSEQRDSADTAASDELLATTEQSEQKVESDFEKRFWAERGANNRSFKAIQRLGRKEERQKQNRLRRPRNW